MLKIRNRLYEKTTIGLFFAVTIFAACQQAKQEEQDNIAVAAASENIRPLTASEDSLQELHRNIPWDQIEVFPFPQALINNKVPLFTNRQQLERLLGAPDSVISAAGEDICGSQFEEDFNYYYKNGATFEEYKDSLACEEFVFIPNSTLTCGKITLSCNTTWEDIKRWFPNAVLQAENEGKTDMITLRDSYSKESVSSVQLYFENGKLVRVVNFIPC
ncbi:hypothetical protein ACDQ55_06560 [Chitinophaga sp. 30R24]|uniref:hypothetical protein n=1 Tax=Chitinophaga sp. 30R24 TaxID=3248838 RepID=UPI003B90ACEA